MKPRKKVEEVSAGNTVEISGDKTDKTEKNVENSKQVASKLKLTQKPTKNKTSTDLDDPPPPYFEFVKK